MTSASDLPGLAIPFPGSGSFTAEFGTVLNTAGFVSRVVEPVVDRSDTDEPLQLTHEIAQGKDVVTWQLRWQPATFAQARVVRDHHRANAFKRFRFCPPGVDGSVEVVYQEPPRIRWASRTAADVQVTLREVY
jgi:hypothetical protein